MITSGETGQLRIIDESMTEEQEYIVYCVEIKSNGEDIEYITLYFWDENDTVLQSVLKLFREAGFQDIPHNPTKYHNDISPRTWALCHQHWHFEHSNNPGGNINLEEYMSVLQDLNKLTGYFKPSFFIEVEQNL